MASDGKRQSKATVDGLAFVGNISSSVLLIYCNKVLMSNTKGYGFRFATTLCALHFLTCTLGTFLLQSLGKVRKTSILYTDLIIFALAGNVSIASLNLSLMLNPVAFYQIAKLCIIPCTCVLEAVWLKRRFPAQIIASIALVLTGVAIVTITDIGAKGNIGGAVIALVSVISSALQQIFCRTMQQRNGLSFLEFLSHTAPAQGFSLIFVGPLLDYWIGGNWLFSYRLPSGGLTALVTSCLVAVAVNVSQLACLGRFQATTFQVLGHGKTILVLLVGWALLGDTISGVQLFGMSIAILGMVLYGYLSSVQSGLSKLKTNESKRENIQDRSSFDTPRQHGLRKGTQSKLASNV